MQLPADNSRDEAKPIKKNTKNLLTTYIVELQKKKNGRLWGGIWSFGLQQNIFLRHDKKYNDNECIKWQQLGMMKVQCCISTHYDEDLVRI